MNSKYEDESYWTAKTKAQILARAAKLGLEPIKSLTKPLLVKHVAGLVYERNSKIKDRSKEQSQLNYDELIPKYAPEYKFEDQDGWMGHLKEFGWVTVPIPDFESDYYVNSFWRWLEKNYAVDRENPDTWRSANLPYQLHGILKNNVGHCKWIWKARLASAKIFEAIYGTDRLLSSFDGACFLFGSETSKNYKQWLHCDQGRFRYSESKSNWEWKINRPTQEAISIQGAINLIDCGPKDGGLIVLEKSNTVYDKYLENRPSTGFQWFTVDRHDKSLKGLELVKVCCKKNSILLWDSRTFHSNIAPKLGKTIRTRMVIYVCMMPKDRCTKAERIKRKALFQDRKMTGHWCYGPWMSQNRFVPDNWVKIKPDPEKLERFNVALDDKQILKYV